ncbi:MAG: DUF1553 domain-containing protein, partial [Planctomycetia bacterium]|nr:DUF1553 domain-containing protein [Planctomycetia bacterium]
GDQEHQISPYRDWVIQAFNDNVPFDRFTTEQLAGDLLPEATVEQKIASGYNRLLQTSHEGGVQRGEYQHKYDADRVRNLGAVWMGATLGCCECHSHKFDPYTQKDFYSLVAIFADIDDNFKGVDSSPTKREPEMDVLSPIDRRTIERFEAEAARLQEQLKATAGSEDKTTSERIEKELEELHQEIERLKKQTRRTMITRSIEPRTVRVLPRGNWLDNSGEIAPPAVPEFLKPLDTGGTDGTPAAPRRVTRLDLARWLTSPNHAQTSRVFVNRLWHLFFGEGLCRSLEDTGVQGQSPTHPELLDWLAVEFVESGWDVKHVVRLLVTSSAYRQSSQSQVLSPPSEGATRRGRDPNSPPSEGGAWGGRDPENRLFARQGHWRLPAEMVRDNALAVSGLLVDRVGGPSARPYQPAGYYQHLNFPKRDYLADKDQNQYRRGVYVHWQRTYLHPMLVAFDAPTREECTARRPISNTPQAALALLNDPTFVEAAQALAVRVIREGGTTPTQRVRWVWKTVLTRPPKERESATLLAFYEESRVHFAEKPDEAKKLLGVGLYAAPKEIDAAELAAWTAVARAMLNLNETITRY